MYNHKKKEFYDGRTIDAFMKIPIFEGKKSLKRDKNLVENNLPPPTSKQDNLDRSHRRTKQAIYDLAFNNPWQWFITVTFDKEKVDRYNYQDVSAKHSNMLRNLRIRKAPNMRHLMVPELHQDGAIHFHGLLMNIDGLTLLNSGKKDGKNRVIYNCPDFSLGFTTLTRIENPAKAATYISKYISKEVSENLPGKKYWHSRVLNEVKITKEMLELGTQKELISKLKNSVNFAGEHYSAIETSLYQNEFTYIVSQNNNFVGQKE